MTMEAFSYLRLWICAKAGELLTQRTPRKAKAFLAMTKDKSLRHCEALAEAIHNFAYRKLYNVISKEVQDYRLPRLLAKSRNDDVESLKTIQDYRLPRIALRFSQ